MADKNMREVIIPCDCGCSKLEVIRWEGEEGAYLSHFRATFYTEQDTITDRIMKYFKSVWYVVTGQDYRLYEVVLTEESIRKLKDALTRI